MQFKNPLQIPRSARFVGIVEVREFVAYAKVGFLGVVLQDLLFLFYLSPVFGGADVVDVFDREAGV